MKRTLFAAVALAALAGLSRPAPSPAADTASIYDTLLAMKEHTILAVAVTEANEVAALKGEGPYTLFAPTDAAFKKLDDATIKSIATDKATVGTLLRAHMADGKHTTAQLKKLDGMELKSLQGISHKVEAGKDGFRVGGAKLVVADITCSNGVIHVIDAVLPLPK